MIIHKEGYHILFLTTAVLFTLNAAVSYFFPSSPVIQNSTLGICATILLLTLYFFRAPKVTIQSDSQNIIAPCSGKIVAIEEITETEYFHDTRKQVSILASINAPHVTHTPLSGQVKHYRHYSGKRFFALHPQSSTDNEQAIVVIQNEKSVEVLTKQIAGPFSKSITNYILEKQKVEQGQPFGFITTTNFRMDIFLPLDTQINVYLGQKIILGKTLIATL